MLLVKEDNKISLDAEEVRNRLQHIAIIMDGNGRWAKSRRLPKFAGHKKGADSVRGVVKQCAKLGIKYLTLYAFSSENWNRPEDEVNDLMGLLKIYLTKEIDELHRENIKLCFIGSRARLSSKIIALIDDAEARTRNNDKI